MTGLDLAPGATPTVTVLTLVSLALFGAAILLRRWPLWLIAVLVSVLAVGVAFLHSDAPRHGDRTAACVRGPTGVHVAVSDVVEYSPRTDGVAGPLRAGSGFPEVPARRRPVTEIENRMPNRFRET